MFLLDTSTVSALVNAGSPSHAAATAFAATHSGQEQRLFVCVVTLAEMQFGLGLIEGRTPKPSTADLEVVRRRIQAASTISQPLDVTRHVALEQGRLRARWAWKSSPRRAASGKLKGAAPEAWSDNWPATTLQITENDLWIAAVALTHDLTLVTLDGDFLKLIGAEDQLRVVRL